MSNGPLRRIDSAESSLAERTLDLGAQDADEYEGSTAEIAGVSYVVGRRIGGGEEHLVHLLKNPKTGLTFFVIKLPTSPWVSERYDLDSLPYLNLSELSPPVAAIAIGGHRCQIQEYIGPYSDDDQLVSCLKAADDLVADKRWDDAIAAYDLILRDHPRCSVAMNNCAVAHSEGGDESKAWQLAAEACTLEPHKMGFALTMLKVVGGRGRFDAVLKHYRSVSALFPNVSLDEAAAELLLRRGTPEEALDLARERLQLLGETGGSGSPHDAYRKIEEIALGVCEKKDRAWSLMPKPDSLSSHEDGSWAKAVEVAYQAFPGDPLLAANYGIALRDLKRYREAAKVFGWASFQVEYLIKPTCLLNGAIAALLDHKEDTATTMFEDLMQTSVVRLATSREDLPELAIAVYPGGVIIEVPGKAESMIRAHYQTSGLAEHEWPPALRELLKLYSRFPAR